jgi:raffinose/stachyose/melibiose transport system permease protein
MATDSIEPIKRPFRWHILVFLAPAALVYTAVMIFPLVSTLYQSFFSKDWVFVGFANFIQLFTDPRLSASFWNALGNNVWFFIIHMLVQNPIGILLAALLSNPKLRLRGFYRTVFFIPTLLSFVIVGFVWKLILSPVWGVTQGMMKSVGLGWLYQPWLGKEDYALTTLALISNWQFIGIPMMLIYAALLSIPDEVIEAAECDGITGWSQFWTFVGNFNAFDLVYAAQGAQAGPNFSTDLLGTLLYRTFFGAQLQLGDRALGSTIAAVMFLIILAGVCIYLFGIQTRLRRYQM